ncbi:unnamed protein product, partial [marine sediment metagenome]
TYGYRRVHAILKRQALAAGSIAMLAVSSGGMTAASQSMSAIGAGAPMASRSAATMARGCELRLRSIAVIGKP